MDSLNYKYNRDVNGNIINNRLNHVRDQVSSSNYTADIDNQNANNYTYDYIGNLKTDAAEGINNINWTVYGKIKEISKTAANTTIQYGYDPGGNRTTKKVTITGGTTDEETTTWYIRDAQGNVMAVYSKKNTAAIKWNEQHLYGSSRLGMWSWDTTVPAYPPVVRNTTPIYDSLLCGSRTYELSNHLGNVLTTISDKKIGHNNSGVVDYYEAEVLTANDYYPFGMELPGRTYTIGNGYRYSINGQEKTPEIAPNTTTAEFWQYDARIVRRWNVDPRPNIAISPYNCFAGNPIWYSDSKGDTSKFFGNDAKLLYQNNEGKGTSMYVVDNKQFTSFKSKYKKTNKLTQELSKLGVKAYASEDEAAKAWAPDGAAATMSDPNKLERAASIFHFDPLGDKSRSNLYILGNTVVGQKSTEPGISQEVDPFSSTLSLNGKDISKYTHLVRVPIFGEIEVKSWVVSGVIHTHPPGKNNFSISNGDLLGRGPAYGGDISFPMSGYTTYLVPTGLPYREIFKLTPKAVGGPRFRTLREGEEYMRREQQYLRY